MAEKSGFPKGKASRVRIDFEDSVETATPKAKANGPVSKGGDSAKAGKARTTDKKAASKTEDFSFEQDLPKTTTCLMDCEAAQILQGIHESMVVLSADPTLKIPVSFGDGLMYAKRRGIPSDAAAVRKILEPLKKKGVLDSEICKIANLKVESADEVFALVPSLKDKKDKLREPLKQALEKLSNLNK